MAIHAKEEHSVPHGAAASCYNLFTHCNITPPKCKIKAWDACQTESAKLLLQTLNMSIVNLHCIKEPDNPSCLTLPSI